MWKSFKFLFRDKSTVSEIKKHSKNGNFFSADTKLVETCNDYKVGTVKLLFEFKMIKSYHFRDGSILRAGETS